MTPTDRQALVTIMANELATGILYDWPSVEIAQHILLAIESAGLRIVPLVATAPMENAASRAYALHHGEPFCGQAMINAANAASPFTGDPT